MRAHNTDDCMYNFPLPTLHTSSYLRGSAFVFWQATTSMTSTPSIRWHQTSPGPTFPALFGGSSHPPGPTMVSCARVAGFTCLQARVSAWVSRLKHCLLTGYLQRVPLADSIGLLCNFCYVTALLHDIIFQLCQCQTRFASVELDLRLGLIGKRTADAF